MKIMFPKSIKSYSYGITIFFALMLSGFILWLGAKIALNYLNENLVEFISPKQETDLTQQYINQVLFQNRLCNSKKVNDVLSKCANFLQGSNNDVESYDSEKHKDYKIKISIIDDTIVNAFTMPGGWILFTKD